MTVVTRFAPSPTGFLHIGGARTALFNWLFSRHHGGKFLLRIEDTDKKRSTAEAIDAILEGMRWLELDWDDEEVYQSRNAETHAAVAHQLLAEGKAYKCYCTPDELDEMRAQARAEGRSMRYDGRWRDRDPADAPSGIDPVIRLKAPQDGETVIADAVQGDVRVANAQLDDMVLLRSDGTPTYMLSVVVDDHNMDVTHIIRGDDHLNNAARQAQLFQAMGWDLPVFAHIPLIHGPDGKKLSKRHGALGVDAYRDMGYLPEALRNYLLRLGWSHGDDEIITTPQAIEWFSLDNVGQSAARFDFDKLESINAHYLQTLGAGALVPLLIPHIAKLSGSQCDDTVTARLERGLGGLRQRAKTIVDMAQAALIYAVRPTFPLENAKAAKLLEGDAPSILTAASETLMQVDEWTEQQIEAGLRELAEKRGVGLGKIAQPLRAAITGSNASPSMFEVMYALGRNETLARISAANL